MVEYGGVELMVDTQILTLRNSSFDPLKLKAGQERKKENQKDKQHTRVKRREKGVVGRLIGEINEKYKDKIYEISEHRLLTLFGFPIKSFLFAVQTAAVLLAIQPQVLRRFDPFLPSCAKIFI